jgi:FlaA1/EpsC-like NDP-sugar epimerase
MTVRLPSFSPNRFTNWLLDLPRPAKRLIALSLDAGICVSSVWFAFYLRLGYWPHPAQGPLEPMMASMAIALPIFVSFGLYRAIFRYAGSHALMTILRAVALYSAVFATIYTVVSINGTPRTVGLIQPLVLLLLVTLSRMFARLVFAESYTALWRDPASERVLIYGAGNAGRELAVTLGSSKEMKLVGFVDDDRTLWRAQLMGVTIYSPDDLEALVRKDQVTDVLLAIPSATRQRRSEIVARLKRLELHVRTLPSMTDIARGRITVGDLKELDIADLLGRPMVAPNLDLLQRTITGRTVLVTGAGGSIGSELCRQIAQNGPRALLLVDHSEYNLYSIHRELQTLVAGRTAPVRLVPLLASVCDRQRMEHIFENFAIDTVFHAAAYKHVPLVEQNLLEGVRNNTFGTLTTAQIAARAGAKEFVLISTDKAVRPTNVMGAAKRCAEMVIQALDEIEPKTRFSMVRFGNVLGSSGSVLPLFREQVAAGGPVTLTHAEITRYFMTIPEAAQLVLQAGAMAVGGDVFVLDMGEPVRIIDLARSVIELSGRTVRDEERPDGDIEIRVDGLRPGEKLHEELLIGGEIVVTAHPRIMRSNERYLPWSQLEPLLTSLQTALAGNDAGAARQMLRQIVPEFTPNSPLVDLLAVAGEDAGTTPAASSSSITPFPLRRA